MLRRSFQKSAPAISLYEVLRRGLALSSDPTLLRLQNEIV
jgi:hypothetical protein